MELIDTHSHIFSKEFESDIDAVLERAQKAQVSHILMPNIDVESFPEMMTLANTYPTYCFPMVGLHPTSVDKNWEKNLDALKKQYIPHRFIGVGEIGMDLYRDSTFIEEQKNAFSQQLRWAKEWNLPISVHSRNAHEQTMLCIRQEMDSSLRGVIHSFSGSEKELAEIMELPNLMIGINGIVTFKNSHLRKVLLHADIERIVIETDAPYLAPVPFRGKRNEPAHTLAIAHELATIFQLSVHEIAHITCDNAKRMFHL